MNKKVIIITAVSLTVAGAGIFGGIKMYQNYQQNNLVAEAEYVSNLNSYYGDMGTSSSGMVTNDFFQDVYILEDKKIVEVFVEEGQTVEAGDPLISYDMTMSQLELEMKELDVSTSSSKIEAAKKELEKLKKIKPVSRTPVRQPEPVIPQEPEIPETPAEPEVPEKTGEAYNIIRIGAKPNKGKGTEENPYVYLCTPECYVLGEFINQLSDRKSVV